LIKIYVGLYFIDNAGFKPSGEF